MKHKHTWTVYSTAVGEGCLMLECKCGAFGTIDIPTLEEWQAAFHAPSNPYLWDGGDERVHVRKGPPNKRLNRDPSDGKENRCC